MIFESAVRSTLFYGLVSAASLPLGAASGVVWHPPDRVMALLPAFGVDRGHFEALANGGLSGGFLFELLDWLVNRKGGYLCKPSTAMNYWRNQARHCLRAVPRSARRRQPHRLSADVADKLLSVMLMRDIPAGIEYP